MGNETRPAFRLDPKVVEETFRCCTEPTAAPTDADPAYPYADRIGPIDMIVSAVFLNKKPLQDHAEQIMAMLLELPDEFRESGGGGWSFLNACNDRHGNLWTGEHRVMGMLVALGLGLGVVKYLVPRDLWPALPGGMPYFVVKDRTPLDPTRLRIRTAPRYSSE